MLVQSSIFDLFRPYLAFLFLGIDPVASLTDAVSIELALSVSTGSGHLAVPQLVVAPFTEPLGVVRLCGVLTLGDRLSFSHFAGGLHHIFGLSSLGPKTKPL